MPEEVKKFTIDEFRRYIFSQDSLGDVLYYLSVENIEKANIDEETFEEE